MFPFALLLFLSFLWPECEVQMGEKDLLSCVFSSVSPRPLPQLW